MVESAGLALDVRARDLASLGAALTVDALPACSDGNGTAGADSRLVNTTVQTYDGPVHFMSLNTEYNYLYFSLDNLPGALLQLRVPSDLFPTPAANTAFWLTQYEFGTMALRPAQGAPFVVLVLSTSVLGLPDSTRELGVPVTVEARCDYGPQSSSIGSEPARLWDLVLGTNPPVRVPTATVVPLQIGGRNYTASSGKGGHGYALYAR